MTNSSPPDSGSKNLSPQDYIQTIHVLFRDFTTEMALGDHDVALDKADMLPDYCASRSEVEVFPATALRQLHHFYANYVQSLHFLAHPTMDFQTNKKDVVHAPEKAATQPDLQAHLVHNLEQIELALDIYRKKLLPDGHQNNALAERFNVLQDNLANGRDIIMPANQNPASGLASAHKQTPKIG